MSAKVKELIDDLVWSECEMKDITLKTVSLCQKHVLPMLNPRRVLKEMEEWAGQQAEKHSKHSIKIARIHSKIETHHAGIQGLQTHHGNISVRYLEVARGIREVMYFN